MCFPAVWPQSPTFLSLSLFIIFPYLTWWLNDWQGKDPRDLELRPLRYLQEEIMWANASRLCQIQRCEHHLVGSWQSFPSGLPQLDDRPPPALPSKFDGDHFRGQGFLNSCQTYMPFPRLLPFGYVAGHSLTTLGSPSYQPPPPPLSPVINVGSLDTKYQTDP